MENQTEQTTTLTTRQTGMRYGLILGIISIAYFVILSVAGVDMQGAAQWAGVIFTIGVFILAHKYFKENGDGFMSFGQGVGIGFWTSLVSSVISSIFTFIYVSYIDASFVENMKQQQIEQMQERGMSDAQIDQAMEFAGMFMSPTSMLIFGIVGGVVIGVIVALIVTIFTQKANPEASV
jgi:hypothetical protein